MAAELTAPIIKKGVVIDGITGTFGSVIDAVVFYGYDYDYPYIQVSDQVIANPKKQSASSAGKKMNVTLTLSDIDEVKVYCMPFRNSGAGITSFTSPQAVGTYETVDTGYLLTLNTAGLTSCSFSMSNPGSIALTAFIICHN